MKTFLIVPFLIFIATFSYSQNAELHINNTSNRTMDIKIMRSSSNGASSLYSRLKISPQSEGIEYFPTTGYFFLKIKASRYGQPIVYSKGDPFRVYVGSDGYDVLTITYSIEESTLDPLSGETISPAEFEKDN